MPTQRMTPEQAKKLTPEEFLATTRTTLGMDTNNFFRENKLPGTPIPTTPVRKQEEIVWRNLTF